MSFSQNAEEEAILQYVQEHAHIVHPGRFLDIGAADGVTFSNTRALAELGWGGVCVDASPGHAAACRELYADREDVHVAQRAIITEGGGNRRKRTVTFWDTPDLVGTISEEHRDKWIESNGVPFSKITVEAWTPTQLLERYPGPYDLVNIDTEGNAYHIWTWLMRECALFPALYVVEHDGEHVDISNVGREHGYSPLYLDGNNIILGR